MGFFLFLFFIGPYLALGYWALRETGGLAGARDALLGRAGSAWNPVMNNQERKPGTKPAPPPSGPVPGVEHPEGDHPPGPHSPPPPKQEDEGKIEETQKQPS